MKLKEKISLEEVCGQTFKVRVVEASECGKAVFTHYLLPFGDVTKEETKIIIPDGFYISGVPLAGRALHSKSFCPKRISTAIPNKINHIMKINNWTKEETIVAFNVYCKIPFKNSSKTNPTVIKYANIIGRSPSALNMKIGNFGRLDPELKKQGITGLVNGSKLEEEVWNEFNGNWEELAFESEQLIAKFQNKTVEENEKIILENLPDGKESETIVKTRVNQIFSEVQFFLHNNLRCCITGLSITDFLVASHIKPWAKDKGNRTNPHNGVCLNSIHDKAFDKGFITITTGYKILLSRFFNDYSNEQAVNDFFRKYENRSINLPDRFLPSKEFLEYHQNEIFIK